MTMADDYATARSPPLSAQAAGNAAAAMLQKPHIGITLAGI
jgi:hypothetical protein